MTARIATADLANSMETALPPLTEADRRLNRTLVRLLAEGEPVTSERLAAALDRPAEEVAETVDELQMAYRDDDGRVIGYWGLAIGERLSGMPHRLRVDGREVYGWCAFDTLFLALVLGGYAEIESRCPATGERISLQVTPEGVRDLDPPSAVMSALIPSDDGFTDDVIRGFCHFIHFFSSEDAADAWIAEREGTFRLSIEDSFELARLWAERSFGVSA